MLGSFSGDLIVLEERLDQADHPRVDELRVALCELQVIAIEPREVRVQGL